jgi:spermidine synthase
LLPWVFALIGLTAVVAQIVLMRELIVVFHGNEISLGVVLASWLFWTAVGSGPAGRIAARSGSPRRTVAGLQAALAVVFPLTIIAARAGSAAYGATPGEILGPGPMFLTSFAALSAFCVISGALFAAGGRLYAVERTSTTATATSSVYLLEAVGAAVGGVLASIVLIRTLSPLEIALTVSVLNFFAAAALTLGRNARRTAAIAVGTVACGFFVVFYGGGALESASLRYQWRGFDYVETRQSIYGSLTVTAGEGSRTLYENGSVLATFPDPAAAEEAVHFALLQHSSPVNVLLIGGGVSGALAETLVHPSIARVDYVELDPTVLDLAFHYHRDHWEALRSDIRVAIHHVDGRLFLQRSGRRYDAIIVNLPDPRTAQLNRVYTREFFRLVADHLAPAGVFSFRVSGAANYISDELAEFLRCVNRTLQGVFPQVVAIPGPTIHFFAAGTEGTLAATSGVLVERLRNRGIETQYVREYYIPFRMMPDRMDDLKSQIEPQPHTPTNADFKPVAYYFNTVLWSTRFHEVYRRLFVAIGGFRFVRVIGAFAAVLLILIVVTVWRFRGQRRLRAGAGGCVAAMGFSMIGLEVLLLLAFQAMYGYVYHQLAVLIAAFMAGMALGSWVSLRRFGSNRDDLPGTREATTLFALQIIAVVFPIVLFALLVAASRVNHPAGVFVASNIFFPVLALLSGGLGGFQFPIASRVYFGGEAQASTGPGAVYALDLAGACVGAAVISAFFIPVFGFFETVWLVAAVNAAPAVVLALSLAAGRRAGGTSDSPVSF